MTACVTVDSFRGGILSALSERRRSVLCCVTIKSLHGNESIAAAILKMIWTVLQLGFVIAMVTGIHFVEAYLLNPAIYSAHLKLHPLLVLTTLVVAEHSLGVWGLLLAGMHLTCLGVWGL